MTHMPPSERADYRPDIDGLRAIAVVLVLLYHGELLGVSGGFIGVDVFFVISGFLITQQLIDRVRQPQDLWSFYERRARRILPALFLMLAVTSVLATCWLLPQYLSSFGRGLLASVAFVSNLHFWLQTGYFQGAAETEPLLHTWSLAIEEQYYLFFPLLLMALMRHRPRLLQMALLALAGLSIAVSIWATDRHPSANFYLAPTRIWELLIGAGLATLPRAAASPRWAELAATAGLVMVMVGALAYTRSTPFPGLAAFVPCVGAALLLYYTPSSVYVRKLLSCRPIVGLGLVSYSLYLWHWPMLVLYTQNRIYDVSAWERALVLGLSGLAAWGSWRYIESPIRSRRWLRSRRNLLIGCLFSALILGGYGFALWGGFASGRSHTPEVNRLLAVADEKNGHFLNCTGNTDINHKACRFGADVPPRYLLWGDSHALALVPGLALAAATAGESIVYVGSQGCAALYSGNAVPVANQACAEINTEVLASLHSSSVEHVILASRWVALVEGRTRELGPAEYDEPALIQRYTERGVTRSNSADAFKTLMQATLDQLDRLDLRASLIYPVPEVGYAVPEVLARLSLAGQPLSSFKRPLHLFEDRSRRTISALDQLRAAHALVRIRPAHALCDAETCRVERDGHPLYLDDDHLSRYGAEQLAPLLAPIFEHQPAG